ncbi:MAG: 30S ribosomal protein S16 [Deltaproteobacteria bacterium HGW-Deltaproteobacteria-14]|nr:MAG: 30S ribosomal protein S16 [Deltaproteobacteria bacterium HGW-Deltaproteobacteria-14]
MAVKLRLARHGSKKRPYYRLVVANDCARRDGRFLEHVGSYDPAHNPPAVALKRDRIEYWLGQGATATYTVDNLLAKFMNAPDTAVRPVKKVRTLPSRTAAPAAVAAAAPAPTPAPPAAPAEVPAPAASESPDA